MDIPFLIGSENKHVKTDVCIFYSFKKINAT